MKVTCPSGLKGEIRKLRGAEADALADKKAAKRGETFDQILSGCWVKTEKAGPYDLPEGEGNVPWGSILVCDRFYTLLQIRIASYGPEYAFKVGCPSCGEKFEWEINLDTDLDIYDLPKKSCNAVASGNNVFEGELGDKKVTFKLQDGDGEKKSGKKLARNKEELVTTAIASRILTIEGVEQRDIVRFLQEEVDIDHQFDLLDQMDEVDGGVETDIEVECPECDTVFEVQLPFGDTGFWLPQKSKRKKKKRTPRKRR